MALPGVAQRLTGPKLSHYGDLVDRLLSDPDSVTDTAEAMHAVKILALRLKTAERRLNEIREDNRLLLGLYRRALLKGSPQRPSEDRVAVSAQRLRLYEAAGGTCAWCGRFMLLGDVAIDHITPKERLGLNCENNLQALHDACNAEKRTRSMADAPPRPLPEPPRLLRVVPLRYLLCACSGAPCGPQRALEAPVGANLMLIRAESDA